MAEPVRARRLTDQEGGRLQQIVRRGKHGSVRVRRAMIIMASASGTPVTAIARLVAADEDTVRDVIHALNQKGLAALDPQWAGGRPRLISDEDVDFIVATATTRPEKLGLPFTRWSLRKLAAYLGCNPARMVAVGRERLRQILHSRQISFQRTRTWKESADPDKDAKLDRIEHVTSKFPGRCFAFDQFGPLSSPPPRSNADDEPTLVTDPAGNATLTCYDGDGNDSRTVPPTGVAAGSLTPASCPAAYPAGYSDGPRRSLSDDPRPARPPGQVG